VLIQNMGIFQNIEPIWLTFTCDFTVYSFPFAKLACVGGCARGGGREPQSRDAVRVHHPYAATRGLMDVLLTKEGWAMAQVTVVVNGRSFRMGCRDGEEARVQELAAEIDTHVQSIRGGTKAVQDDRLFLMAAIMMADQLWDAREELQKLRLVAESRAYHVIEGGAQAMQRDLSRALEASAGSNRCINA